MLDAVGDSVTPRRMLVDTRDHAYQLSTMTQPSIGEGGIIGFALFCASIEWLAPIIHLVLTYARSGQTAFDKDLRSQLGSPPTSNHGALRARLLMVVALVVWRWALKISTPRGGGCDLSGRGIGQRCVDVLCADSAGRIEHVGH
ncbi:hypothetical protein [Salinisphaera sp. T31B1]|uniref:hypothetical protein n=1 Tax=Salinisphaera sp. T31B1 TaxID=727963 RepID=UPI00333FE92C